MEHAPSHVSVYKRFLRRWERSPFTARFAGALCSAAELEDTRPMGMYWTVGRWQGIPVYAGDYCRMGSR